MSIFRPYKYVMIRMTWKARFVEFPDSQKFNARSWKYWKRWPWPPPHGLPLFPPFLDSTLHHEGPCIYVWGHYSQEVQAPSSHPAPPTNSCDGDCPALGVCTPAMSLTLGRIDPGKNLVQAQDKSWAIWTMNSGSQVSSIVQKGGGAMSPCPHKLLTYREGHGQSQTGSL